MARPSSTRVGQVDQRRERQAPRWQGPRWQYVVLALLAVLALLLVIGLALGWVRMDLIGGDLQVDLPSVGPR